jgi:hypothetical protein
VGRSILLIFTGADCPNSLKTRWAPDSDRCKLTFARACKPFDLTRVNLACRITSRQETSASNTVCRRIGKGLPQWHAPISSYLAQGNSRTIVLLQQAAPLAVSAQPVLKFFFEPACVLQARTCINYSLLIRCSNGSASHGTFSQTAVIQHDFQMAEVSFGPTLI